MCLQLFWKPTIRDYLRWLLQQIAKTPKSFKLFRPDDAVVFPSKGVWSFEALLEEAYRLAFDSFRRGAQEARTQAASKRKAEESESILSVVLD